MGRSLSLEDIARATTRVEPVDPGSIVALQAELSGSMPPAYAEVIGRFGRSDPSVFGAGYCGLLHVLAPADIRTELARARTEPIFAPGPHWPNARGLFTDDDLAELVPLARSIDAELLAFLPAMPDAIFYFPSPRSAANVDLVGSTLLEALAWYAKRHRVSQPFHDTGLGRVLVELEAWDEPAGSVRVLRAGEDPDDEDAERGGPFDTLAHALEAAWRDDESGAGRRLAVPSAHAMIVVDGRWRPGDREHIRIAHDVDAPTFVEDVLRALERDGWKARQRDR